MSTSNDNFAVLLKPGEVQPAIERAAQYARFAPEISVTAVRIINNFTDQNRDDSERRVKAEFEGLKRSFSSIKNFKLKVLFSKNVPEAFTKECGEGGYSMAIISANKRNTIKDLFVSTIDSTVMRNCPIPLLVVKDVNSASAQGKAILIAIDFEESSHLRELDECLFKSAKEFADRFNGEVHVVNCVSPLNRGLMSGDTGLSKFVAGGSVSRMNIHQNIVEEFAKAHDIPLDHTHVVEGRIDEEIPRLCDRLEARMVCMGSNPKSSFLGSINSSACELVLEQIRGDVFIVNTARLDCCK